jgi:hypothetical protein
VCIVLSCLWLAVQYWRLCKAWLICWFEHASGAATESLRSPSSCCTACSRTILPMAAFESWPSTSQVGGRRCLLVCCLLTAGRGGAHLMQHHCNHAGWTALPCAYLTVHCDCPLDAPVLLLAQTSTSARAATAPGRAAACSSSRSSKRGDWKTGELWWWGHPSSRSPWRSGSSWVSGWLCRQ